MEEFVDFCFGVAVYILAAYACIENISNTKRMANMENNYNGLQSQYEQLANSTNRVSFGVNSLDNVASEVEE